MNKPLLGSIVVATLLLGDASAATVYERFEMMEKEMQGLQTELADLKAEKAAADEAAAAKAEEETDEEEPEEADEEEADEDEDEDEEEEEEEDINEILEEMQESISDINRATSGNHIKLDVDFRTAYDNVSYKMAGSTVTDYAPTATPGFYSPAGTSTVDKNQKNNSLLTNRLWLNMNWAANENVSFTGQLAYNKTYGGRFGTEGTGAAYETFDWFVNENANGDGNLRVKSAYWFYRNDTFLGGDTPWTFSLGRRPSTNGHLINYRDDDPAASPSGHTINVEFDGLSSKFSFEKLTGIEGMYIKFCGGQGVSSANEKFSSTPYANNATGYDIEDIHLAGMIFVPYDDGQYSIGTQGYVASNLPGQNIKMVQIGADPFAGGTVTDLTPVGDLISGSVYAMINGIGDEWSDFLDDTTFFASGAMSRTHPGGGVDQFGQPTSMLGSSEMENGYSYWAGLVMPSLVTEEGRFGLEFNHGSKYWRPITYGEDTMIGSKVAARGDAYEVYFTEPLVEDSLSLQIRFTYIDYKYTGSNGFFGNATGTPLEIDQILSNPMTAANAGNVVDIAQDLRLSIRYRY